MIAVITSTSQLSDTLRHSAIVMGILCVFNATDQHLFRAVKELAEIIMIIALTAAGASSFLLHL